MALDEVWPWRRVMDFYDRFIQRRFERILPEYQSQAMLYNINRKQGSRALTAIDMMPESFVPAALRDPNKGQAKYSREFVEAFELAMHLRIIDNGMLAALNSPDLRASGAKF